MDQASAFLQSEHWFAFQKATGKKTVSCARGRFFARGVFHTLPFVGSYLYVPRGPILGDGGQAAISILLHHATREKAGWIRIEPASEAALDRIRHAVTEPVRKAPHDMQPREILVIDISRSEEELLASMKPKTRYNIRLAQKRGVTVRATREASDRRAFLDLIQVTAERKEIRPHPRSYYEQLFSILPDDLWYLFVAEYAGQVLAANLLILYDTTATYLHGGSSAAHREVMAPYFLQWEQIRFARARGFTRYDFGGVRTTAINRESGTKRSWAGITRFKTGFSPQTGPLFFPGAYDIILNPRRYQLYLFLRCLLASIQRLRFPLFR